MAQINPNRIVYKQDDGTVSVITPSDRLLAKTNPATNELWTVDDIAKKDVPTGKKYKIIDESDLPTDRSFINAWTADDSSLTDGEGA